MYSKVQAFWDQYKETWMEWYACAACIEEDETDDNTYCCHSLRQVFRQRSLPVAASHLMEEPTTRCDYCCMATESLCISCFCWTLFPISCLAAIAVSTVRTKKYRQLIEEPPQPMPSSFFLKPPLPGGIEQFSYPAFAYFFQGDAASIEDKLKRLKQQQLVNVSASSLQNETLYDRREILVVSISPPLSQVEIKPEKFQRYFSRGKEYNNPKWLKTLCEKIITWMQVNNRGVQLNGLLLIELSSLEKFLPYSNLEFKPLKHDTKIQDFLIIPPDLPSSIQDVLGEIEPLM